ncbi:MAG: GldG family protein [Planctomycetota bacterium]|jgi:hypothetical protein
MEVKRPGHDEETVRHGDVRLPEVTGMAGRGPSRAQVLLHLAGIGLGFLLLLIGLGLGLSRGMWDRLALVPVIAGGALVAGWITINYGFLSAMLKNRRVMVGTNALFMALLATVLVTMVNFIGNRHYEKWDMTAAGVNTLSEKTIQVLESLGSDVTILVCDRAAQSQLVEAYASLSRLLDLYKEESRRIYVEILKPDVDPQKTALVLQKYGIEADIGALFDDVFIASGNRSRNLKLREMMDYVRDPYNPMQSRPTAFKGEQSITSGIVEVSSEKQPKIYVLTGHGERSIKDEGAPGMLELAAALKRDYFALEELAGIPDDGVPEDCDCLMILGPRVPLAADEIASVSRYLQRGGRVFICLDFEGTSGLEGLLGQWGVEVGEDIIISQDARTLLGSPAAFVTINFGEHEITSPLMRFQVAFNFARSIGGRSTPRAEVTTLVSSSAQSYAERDLETMHSEQTSLFDEDEDAKGPISVGVAVEEQANPGAPAAEGKRTARLVVFGDVDAFNNNMMKLGMLFKNLDLCRNSINWLVERKELIAIDARPERQHILAVDGAGKRAVFWLMVAGLPLAVLLMGGLVWAIRSYGSRA